MKKNIIFLNLNMILFMCIFLSSCSYDNKSKANNSIVPTIDKSYEIIPSTSKDKPSIMPTIEINYRNEDIVYEGLIYNIVDEEAICVGYKGSPKDVDIPSYILHDEGDEIPVTSIGSYAFYGCITLKSVTFEDVSNLTNISDLSFAICMNLTDIEIPNSVTNIGNYAFSRCQKLTTIKIPNSVTSIGSYAFSDCVHLMNIEIPNSVTSIGEHAFSYCKRLPNIKIPNNVTNFGEYLLAGCENLKYIEIPNSVTIIEDHAFFFCDMLESVYYTGTLEEWLNINIEQSNSYLTSATVYYYSETIPTLDGNYWYYDNDGNIVIW